MYVYEHFHFICREYYNNFINILYYIVILLYCIVLTKVIIGIRLESKSTRLQPQHVKTKLYRLLVDERALQLRAHCFNDEVKSITFLLFLERETTGPEN